MSTQIALYRGYRFPPEIISYAVWLHHCFYLSFWGVEELLADLLRTIRSKLPQPATPPGS